MMEISSSSAAWASHVSELHKTTMTAYAAKKMTFPVNIAHVNGLGWRKGKQSGRYSNPAAFQSNLWHAVR